MLHGNISYIFKCEVRNAYSMLDNLFVSSNNDFNFEISFFNIVDDIMNFSVHLLVSCILHVKNVCNNNGNSNLGTNNTTFSTYNWRDTAKQQYIMTLALHCCL